MINPQKGIDLMNNTSIIIRILFAVTIYKITEKCTITRHIIYPGKPSWGRKPSKNFLNIDSQYNAKRINQTIQKVLSQVCASLSLFLLLQLQLQTCALMNK
jgi:hypothetical protein